MAPSGFKKNPKFINGLSDYQVILKRNIGIKDSDILRMVDSGSEKLLQFEFQIFQPGSVVAIR